MYNPYDAVVVKPSVPPAQHTDGTVNGSPVDRAATGFDELLLSAPDAARLAATLTSAVRS